MERSTAQGIAGAGALLTIVSLLAPWYALRLGGLDGGQSISGAEALDAMAALVVALAIAAAWTGTARVHPLLPPLAAAALTVLLVAKLRSPPPVSEALDAGADGSLESQFATAFADAFTSALGLRFSPTWGIWLALIGAAAALVGSIAAARQQR
jgi:hypothetical protein